MMITIKGRIARKMRSDVEEFSRLESRWDDEAEEHDHRDHQVDLGKLTRSECQRLHDVLRTSGVQGAKVLAADVAKYLQAGERGVERMTARTVRQAAWMMEFYVASLPHHLIFSPDAYEGGSYVGYYVSDVDYIPEYKASGGGHVDEHVRIDLVWIDQDARASEDVQLFAEDVLGRTPAQILELAGYTSETPTLLDRLRQETERYYDVRDQVGRKYLARGLARDDLDDATGRSSDHAVSWSRRHRRGVLRMDVDGQAAHVVVDVASEAGSESAGGRRRGTSVRLYRWHPWNLRFHAPGEDDLARHLEADENTDFAPELQLPVHPLVPCFDLRRHLRARVHVNNLAEYAYRPEVAAGLSLPARDRALVELLADHSQNDFQDVVGGKGQSMVVLAGGPPGTGKTLTAEVLSEFKGRPLYNVQCSQLGLDPEQVEKNLGVVLARANRWNAILLLDEADVYVRRRRDDLTQNAIVGVFLRLIEYAQCMLFMTTNLAGDVDDAIASRCIVQLRYDLPDAEHQREIWRTLTELNRVDLPAGVVDAFISAHPSISGRDVKHVLKLASFVAARGGRPIDLEVLEFAMMYKPTS